MFVFARACRVNTRVFNCGNSSTTCANLLQGQKRVIIPTESGRLDSTTKHVGGTTYSKPAHQSTATTEKPRIILRTMSTPTTTPEERAEAAAMRNSKNSDLHDKSSPFAFVQALEPVKIDEGTFKYVLIQAEGQSGPKYFVRGVAGVEYHMDAARPTVEALETANVTYSVLGGGRIKHNPAAKEIFIYGYSCGFPWQGSCLHHISVDVCKTKYPDYKITWSADGY
eukprot:m.220733 g.220733  ORF g.220733 m.220733 type:complete len:225 (+) comp19168_c0_seq1:134-808(+)